MKRRKPMNKAVIIFMIVLSLVIGIMGGDCTFSIVMSLFLLPEVLERKNKRSVKADCSVKR